MRKPNNINDLKQCIKTADKKIMIFCVECDTWKQAAVLSHSRVLLKQKGEKIVKDIHLEVCVCSGCECDIEYLLSPANRRLLLENVAKQLVFKV